MTARILCDTIEREYLDATYMAAKYRAAVALDPEAPVLAELARRWLKAKEVAGTVLAALPAAERGAILAHAAEAEEAGREAAAEMIRPVRAA